MMSLYHAANAVFAGEIVIAVELLILIVRGRRML